MCKACGIYKEHDGTFYLATPSDCHDKGAHYVTVFDDSGKFCYTTAPWQVFPNKGNLTQREMQQARRWK